MTRYHVFRSGISAVANLPTFSVCCRFAQTFSNY
jgi:hypothetical protein